MSRVVTRCGFSFDGCEPPTADERLQRYAAALAGHFDPHDHARRAAKGLSVLQQLKSAWRRTKTPNVVPMRRRA